MGPTGAASSPWTWRRSLPELPEVETIVRDLRPQLEGREVRRAWVGEPGVLRYPTPARFRRRVVGQRIARVGRHGKFMLVRLERPGKSAGGRARAPGADGSDAGDLLVVHLGMTGRLGIAEPESELPPHTHMRLLLSSGAELRMQDYRRFGRVLLGTAIELREAGKLPRLGPEPPLSDALPDEAEWPDFGGALTERELGRVLQASHRAVKALLLDQGKVAGLGNIYVDEALFRAGIRPTAIASRLGAQRRRRLYQGIAQALASAVDLRGSSVDDYRDGFGEKGRNQDALLVYGRSGLPCVSCGRPLAKTVIAGRTTVFCRHDQR